MTRLFLELQVARFNELYYRKRSEHFRRWALGSNILSALAASAVLANLINQPNQVGSAFWLFLTGLAAVSAAVAPVLGLGDKGAQMEKAALGHSIVKDRVRRLLNDLKLSELDTSHPGRDQEIEAFRTALAPLDEAPQEKLREKCWAKTLEELPPEQAWSLV